MSQTTLQGTKSVYKNQLYFYTLAMEKLKIKVTKQCGESRSVVEG